MLVVGLTGGIASGKSTVSNMFRDAGIAVICSDDLAHEVVKPGSPALEDIRETFGEDFIDDNGNLDRAAMAELVFRDEHRRRVLESIIHPRIEEERARIIEELARQGRDIVVVDVPLLYESGLERLFNKIIVVYVPPRIQMERLTARDRMSLEEARSRLDSQMPIEDKKGRADWVIDNTGSQEQTREQVLTIIEELESIARSHDVCQSKKPL